MLNLTRRRFLGLALALLAVAIAVAPSAASAQDGSAPDTAMPETTNMPPTTAMPTPEIVVNDGTFVFHAEDACLDDVCMKDLAGKDMVMRADASINEALRSTATAATDARMMLRSSLNAAISSVMTEAGDVSSAMVSSVASLEGALSFLRSDISTADMTHDSAISDTIAYLEDQVSSLEVTASNLAEAAISTSRSHTEEHFIDQTASITTDFNFALDEVREDLGQAGWYEYTYSSAAAINNDFIYIFAVNYTENVAGGFGNWHVEVEARSGHCGGGCHGSYMRGVYFFNAYCEVATLDHHQNSLNGGGTWTVERYTDSYNGHNFGCGMFGVHHNAGLYPYGGPVLITVRSTLPLSDVRTSVNNHSTCPVDCTHGNQCGGGRCAPWMCRVSDCPNHELLPGTCGGTFDRFSNGAENYGGTCNVP